MNKQFKFFLTSAAIAVALVGAVSCQKDYSGDIDELNKKVTELTQKLTDLQTKIDNGEIVTNVEKISGGIKVTTNKSSYDIVNGKDGADGKDGANGKDGSVVKIGDNGNWFIDGVDTGVAASGGKDGKDGKDGEDGKDGKDGKDGSVVTIGENGNWFIDGVDTEVHASGISAVWEDEKLTIYGIEGYDGPYVLDLIVGLKGLAFVPERIYDGLGLITVYEFTAPANNEKYPFVNKEGKATFIATAPTEVTYRMDAENIDVEKYDWSFINRKVFTVEASKTRADADKTDLINILEGPAKDKSFVNFKIQLKKSVEPVSLDAWNDIVALRAEDGEKEPVVSDYAYIEKQTNVGYALIHKDKYEKGKPKFYRVQDTDVEIADQTDFNFDDEKALGIEVTEEGVLVGDGDGGKTKNPTSPVLIWDKQESIDLLDYVETYAKELKDVISTAGINPTYKFFFAGFDDAKKEIIINLADNDPAKAPYLSDDEDKTNQNQFVTLEGSVVTIDRTYVETGRPAIGRTPLIYVQSIYNGVILAEGFIKLEIVEDEVTPPSEDLGYKVFIRHSAEFDYDKIPAVGTYGENGIGKDFVAPNTDLNYDKDAYELVRELNVNWDEMNVKMFDKLSEGAGMSFEQFQQNYDVANPVLLLAFDKDGKLVQPGDLKDDDVYVDDKNVAKFDTSISVGDLLTYYGAGLTIDKLSPSNWKQNTNIVDLKLDPAVAISGPHFVYVVYKAFDNTKNVDAVVKFVYNVKHDHEYTIYKEGNPWKLNPDYILGTQDLLNKNFPGINFDARPYDVWGAVRIKGQDATQEHQMRSGLTEHFLEYMTPFDINEESIYKFEIKNYDVSEVDWEVVKGKYDTVEYTDKETGEKQTHAYVELTGTELKEVIADPTLVPYIYLKTDKALIAKGYDVLVEVEESCQKLGNPIFGYYYVVFKALDAKLNLYNVKLGTFKEFNDYVYAHELVKSITDEYQNVIFEWKDGAWAATEAAETYGISAENISELSVEVKSKLTYPWDTEESFGDNLRAFDAGAELVPAPASTKETGINWWNLGTDLQVDKKAQFTVLVYWGEDILVQGNGTVLVLATANSIHPLHDAEDNILEPVEYSKDGWFQAIAAKE
jgi:hypothetical protein